MLNRLCSKNFAEDPDLGVALSHFKTGSSICVQVMQGSVLAVKVSNVKIFEVDVFEGENSGEEHFKEHFIFIRVGLVASTHNKHTTK